MPRNYGSNNKTGRALLALMPYVLFCINLCKIFIQYPCLSNIILVRYNIIIMWILGLGSGLGGVTVSLECSG